MLHSSVKFGSGRAINRSIYPQLQSMPWETKQHESTVETKNADVIYGPQALIRRHVEPRKVHDDRPTTTRCPPTARHPAGR